MNLKNITLTAIIASLYFYAVKTIGTFAVSIFGIPAVIQSIQIISLLASIVMALFYIYFRKEYLQPEQKYLRISSFLAFIGALGIVLLYVKGMFFVFSGLMTWLYDFSPALAGLIGKSTVEPFLPWFNSLATLLFLIAFFREIPKEGKNSLHTAAIIGIVGTGISFIFHSIIASNYMSIGIGGGLMGWGAVSAFLIFLPFTLIAFLGWLYFLAVFYGEMRKQDQFNVLIPE